MVSVCLAYTFHLTTTVNGKLHYTACYAPFLFRIIINIQLDEK